LLTLLEQQRPEEEVTQKITKIGIGVQGGAKLEDDRKFEFNYQCVCLACGKDLVLAEDASTESVRSTSLRSGIPCETHSLIDEADKSERRHQGGQIQ